jgi:hypothetical protein
MTNDRADLLAVIASAFAERVHLGHRLVGLADRGNVVEPWFRQRRPHHGRRVGRRRRHSFGGSALFGEKDPAFPGCVAYRGLVPVKEARRRLIASAARASRRGQQWFPQAGSQRHFQHRPGACGMPCASCARIDCGERDQFNLLYGARRFVRRLNELGIVHRYEEFPDNHSGVDYRMDESLPFLANALSGR